MTITSKEKNIKAIRCLVIIFCNRCGSLANNDFRHLASRIQEFYKKKQWTNQFDTRHSSPILLQLQYSVYCWHQAPLNGPQQQQDQLHLKALQAVMTLSSSSYRETLAAARVCYISTKVMRRDAHYTPKFRKPLRKLQGGRLILAHQAQQVEAFVPYISAKNSFTRSYKLKQYK